MSSPEYPAYEVIKAFTEINGKKHLIGEIIIAVTSHQEQDFAHYKRRGYVRFVGWSKPDRQHEEE